MVTTSGSIYKLHGKICKLDTLEEGIKRQYFILLFDILCIGYRTFQTKELSFIGSGKLLYPHEYTAEGRDAEGSWLIKPVMNRIIRHKKWTVTNLGGQFYE